MKAGWVVAVLALAACSPAEIADKAVAFVNLPDELAHLHDAAVFRRIELAPDWRALPEGARDMIHIFTRSAAEVDQALPILRDMINPDGMIWVSWPKKASKVPTDVTEDLIRNRALADGLVDVKVCAVDAVWSGLKLVVRSELRGSHANAKGGV